MTDIYGQKGTSYRAEEESPPAYTEDEEVIEGFGGGSFAEEQIAAIRQAIEVEDITWVQLGAELIQTVDRSNAAYGDSTERSAKILAILYPNGVQPEQMHDARCAISIIDKLARIATDKDAFGESAFLDIAGYALLGYRHDLGRHPYKKRNPKGVPWRKTPD